MPWCSVPPPASFAYRQVPTVRTVKRPQRSMKGLATISSPWSLPQQPHAPASGNGRLHLRQGLGESEKDVWFLWGKQNMTSVYKILQVWPEESMNLRILEGRIWWKGWYVFSLEKCDESLRWYYDEYHFRLNNVTKKARTLPYLGLSTVKFWSSTAYRADVRHSVSGLESRPGTLGK